MAQNKPVKFGPVALSTTLTTNILNPPTTTGGVGCGTPSPFIILKHVRIHNKTAGSVTCSFWIGATGANAAGTEAMFPVGTVVPANSYVEWNGFKPLDVADFLVGGAGTATALTFDAEGEIGFR